LTKGKRRLHTTAAAVSSQLVSMPKTTTSAWRFEAEEVAREDALNDDLSGSWFLRRVVSAEKSEGGFGKSFIRESVDGDAIVKRERSIFAEKTKKERKNEENRVVPERSTNVHPISI